MQRTSRNDGGQAINTSLIIHHNEQKRTAECQTKVYLYHIEIKLFMFEFQCTLIGNAKYHILSMIR